MLPLVHRYELARDVFVACIGVALLLATYGVASAPTREIGRAHV